MTVPEYYAALQVARNAEPEVIEKAYRALALKYHPDTAATPRTAHRMRLINEAYAVLGDPVLRRRYDESRVGEARLRSGWEVFWDAGLVGLYRERHSRSGV
ncbi:MAG: molecular chaperone [Actinobacteria bacterium]|nr:MAG: molecular chaperone [Actinomycetota bacterium]